MRILVNDEWGGALGKAFRALGYDVLECGVSQPAESGRVPYFVGDVRDILSFGWDVVVASLPNEECQQEAFFEEVMASPVRCVAIVSLPAMIVPGMAAYDQVIEPGMFGGKDLRPAGLWLKNLPLLEDTGVRYNGLAQAMASQWGGEAFVGASLRMFANG